MPPKRRKNVPLDEYDTLLRVAGDLDRSLRTPGFTPPHGPHEDVLDGLRLFSGGMREHCAATERPDGTLGALELEIGRLEQVTAARDEHNQLIAFAHALTAALTQAESTALTSSSVPYVDGLTAALRVHFVNETDLAQIRFNLDIGGYG